ncbi:hypothetical protein DPMN_087649 [Dreissena polymorpha]|uniref:Uncharacterized protein n=1 Tax=Dreissena polymorpha TaxID=45954 RepID=A0A9D4QVS9_DREPO|nr:hypothetical protein DPMN_087649 [Dreissena polymorpha]
MGQNLCRIRDFVQDCHSPRASWEVLFQTPKVLQSISLNTIVNNNESIDNSENVAEDESFCYCEQGEFGTMICCDNNMRVP